MNAADRSASERLTLRLPKLNVELATEAYLDALIRDREHYKFGSDLGREGVMRSLVHTLTYLNKIGIPNPALEPLLALALALGDLDRGTVSPILVPGPRRGRPPRSSVQEQRDGVIAAVAEAHECVARERGWDHDAAMRQACAMLNRSGQFPRLKAVSVMNIRTRIQASERGTFGRDAYDAIVESPKYLTDPLGSVEEFLAAPLGGGNVNQAT